MKFSAKQRLLEIKKDLLKKDHEKIFDDFRKIAGKKKSITYYLEHSSLKKDEKSLIFREITKALFDYMIDLYLLSKEKQFEDMQQLFKQQVIGTGILDSALIDSTIKFNEKGALGLFVISMIKKLIKTDYQDILFELIDLKKEISKAIVDYLILLDSAEIEKLDEISVFFQKERLLFVMLYLVKEISNKNNPETINNQAFLNITKLIDKIDTIAKNNLNFYLPILIGYLSDVFEQLKIQAVNEVVENIIMNDNKTLVAYAIDWKQHLLERIENRILEKDILFQSKEKQKEEMLDKRLYDNTNQFLGYLCESASRLFQAQSDAESINISEDSNLYQRIIASIEYLKGILVSRGIDILGNIDESVEYNSKFHETIDKINEGELAQILSPVFIERQKEGTKKILKKAQVVRKEH